VFIRPVETDDLAFIREELVRHWGDTGIWSIGQRYQADALPGFVAIDKAHHNERIGLVTFIIHNGGWQGEIITLSSRRENSGIGAALLEAAVNALREAGCARAILTTTNDNLRALGFYQKRGWKLAHLHKGIIDEARKRTAVVPEVGMNGIPIRDEIELELWLR
jgi:GNAT superfamily N-acetyltransferase